VRTYSKIRWSQSTLVDPRSVRLANDTEKVKEKRREHVPPSCVEVHLALPSFKYEYVRTGV